MEGKELRLERKPEALARSELEAKIGHLIAELSRAGAGAILFYQEGAMRWLTGIRHQIVDIAPDAASPVQAHARTRGSSLEISFVTTPFEMPRVKDQLPAVFAGLPSVKISFHTSLPSASADALLPSAPGYSEVMGRIVRPVLGGFSGNQYAKISWLCAATTAVLAETGDALEPGMNGAEVRARALEGFLRRDIESNLVLVALHGQEKHPHPLWDSRYRVEHDCWVKLVAGARHAEMILSATVMVKIGSKVSSDALASYRALQEGVVEYADCYRSGAVEGDIYQEIGRRFEAIEKKHGIPGFGASAYAHHLGGPTSPLGNRDYLLSEGGNRVMFPWMQFAINPLETRFATKVEVQGIVMEGSAPHLLDASRFTPSDLLTFRNVVSSNGTKARVADILER